MISSGIDYHCNYPLQLVPPRPPVCRGVPCSERDQASEGQRASVHSMWNQQVLGRLGLGRLDASTSSVWTSVWWGNHPKIWSVSGWLGEIEMNSHQSNTMKNLDANFW